MKKNRILASILTVCMLISAFAFSASAAEADPIYDEAPRAGIPATDPPRTAEPAPVRPPHYIDYENFYCLYVGHPSQLTHYMVYEFIARGHKEGVKYPIIEALNKLPALPEITVDSSAKVYIDMLFINNSGNKRQMYITANALHVGGRAYQLTDEQYFDLLGIADDSLYLDNPQGFARWLLYLNPHKVRQIICTDESGRTFELMPEYAKYAANYLKSIPVTYATHYKPGIYNFDRVKNCIKVTMMFDDDVVIKVYMTDTEIYIEDNKAPFACKYRTNFRPYVSDYFKQAETGKPKAPKITKPESSSSSSSAKK